MENRTWDKVNTLSVSLIHRIVHPFTVFVTPMFVLALMIYLVARAFMEDFYAGVRSFTGVLFPIITVTFIFVFQRELLEELAKIRALTGYLISLLVGIGLMQMVRSLGHSSTVPITELALSGSFSMLVFSYVSVEGNRILSYYYGMISGFLIYIMFWGFPVMK